MRRWILAVGLVGGCATSEGNPDRAEMEATLRAGLFPEPANYPGNGDLAIYEGTNTASEPCRIYDIAGTQVHATQQPGAPAVMDIVGNSIVDPTTGQAICTRQGNQLYEQVIVGGAGGDVLFTVIGRWVFEGELNLNGNILQILAQLDDQLIYTFQGPHIYEHSPWDGDILATATQPLTNANKTRKLVIASLIAGECGGLGLYTEEEGEHEP
ncbi:MAG TPA: hypothetical protein VG755_42835 [Nannocystaceae bacterium]|nr:hypothetical protein [Nannocystaceae bacterium]